MSDDEYVRVATLQDIDALSRLMHNYWMTMYGDTRATPLKIEPYTKYILEKPTCRSFLCFLRETPVGFLNIDELPSSRYQSRCALYLDIWLEPSCRTFGNVSRLFRAADEYCQKEDIRIGYLHVESDLIRLQHLYKYLGWTKTDLLLFKKPLSNIL